MIDGQRLVASIMSALLDSPSWDKTLFIITYDEHGGFYDHAAPAMETTTTAADGTVTRTPLPPLSTGEPRLGVRVPAFVISPFIESMPDGKVNVRHTVFDHTTIPATILRRFCEGRVPVMGARTSAIADVGELLTLETARPRAEFEQLAREMKQIAALPAGGVRGEVPRSSMRRPQLDRVEDEFHNLIAFASAVTGGGNR